MSSRLLLLGTLALLLALPSEAQVRLQVIHNAADPAAAEVDVYIDGALALDDFAFRTATPFLDLDSDTDIVVAVAPANSGSAADAIFTETYNLASGAYQLIASGVLDPSQFASNPDGTSTAFTLLVAEDAREDFSNRQFVTIRTVHGVTDAPTIDIRFGPNGASQFSDDASYTDVYPYINLPQINYEFSITPAAGPPVLASYQSATSGAGGRAVTFLASGFLTPEDDQNGPALGLLAVYADGSASLLAPTATSTDAAPEAGTLALGMPSPNPASGVARVTFSLDAPGRAALAVYDALGRRVAQVAEGTFAADLTEVRIDTSALASGVYTLRLDAASGSRSVRLSVVR